MAARIIKVAGLVVLATALFASFASAKPYVNNPGLDQGMQSTAVTPNDRAGTQGVGQNSTDFGMGGQYGQNLIQQKAQDIQKAKTFKLPAPPDERAGTTTGVETPYLSIGGVAAQSTPTLVPYLSHGIGVNPAQFSGAPVRPDDSAGARPSEPTSAGNDTYDVGGVLVTPNAPAAVAAPVSATGDGFDWGSAGIGAAGFAAIALAIGLLVVLGRRSRHEGVAVS